MAAGVLATLLAVSAPVISATAQGDSAQPDPATATPAEAEEIFSEQQAEALAQIDSDAVALGGENVVEYRGDQLALIAEGGEGTPLDLDSIDSQAILERLAERQGQSASVSGGGSLVLSTSPLRAPDEQGDPSAVDLTLDRLPSGELEPVNPLVPVVIGASAEEAVAVGEQAVQVGVPTEQGASPPVRRVDDLGAFYAEVDTDTDLFVAPRTQGAELYAQLRSAEAPAQLALEVSTPGETALEPAASGAVEILSDGKPEAIVHPPIASDASGEEIPARLEVVDGRLYLQVDHLHDDTAYPVEVDPLIEDYNWPGGTTGMSEWSKVPDPPPSKWDLFRNNATSGGCLAIAIHCPGRGLYSYAKKSQSFAYGERAGFYYFPVRKDNTTAFAEKAVFNPVRFWRNGDGGGSPQLKVGIFDESLNAPTEIDKKTQNDDFNGSLTVENLGDDSRGKQVRFELNTSVGRTTGALHEAYLGGAKIYLDDKDTPQVTITAEPASDWVRSSVTSQETVSVQAIDQDPANIKPGLGIKALGYGLYRPDGTAVTKVAADQNPTPAVPACDGSRETPCPVSHSASATYSTARSATHFSEGINYALMLAYDALGKAGAASWWIKIDDSDPKASLSGPLSGDGLANLGDNTLTVAATDGNVANNNINDAATRREARSGVAWMELRVGAAKATGDLAESKKVARVGDGGGVTWTPNATVGSTAHTYTFTLDCNSIRPGLHSFQVLIGDYAGNVRKEPIWTDTACLQERIDRDPEKLGLERYFDYDSTEAGLSGLHVNTGTGNAVWHSVPMVNPGRGLSSVLNLTYNSFDYPELGDIPLDSRFISLDYDEAGLGFSLGLSGITRINEPLGGVLIPNVIGAAGTKELGAVVLTDPDGTTHVFRPDLGKLSTGSCAIDIPTRYKPPPGVNLELRRYSCPSADTQALVAKVVGKLDPSSTERPLTASDFLGLALNPTSGQPELWPGDEDEPNKKLNDLRAGAGAIANSSAQAFAALYALEDPRMWAITRPDGVTYFYNGFGFPTETLDRNGNKLTYEYEKVTPVGQSCSAANTGIPIPAGRSEPPIIPGLCEPRLVRVKDAAAADPGVSAASRTITIDYYDLADIGGPSASALNLDQTLGGLLGQVQAALAVPANVNKLNKIQTITDHAARTLSFDYDASGLLTKLTEGGRADLAGNDISRYRRFDYETATPSALSHPQLLKVSQPTAVGANPSAYTTLAYAPQSGVLSGRRVRSVTNREGDARTYAYVPGSGGTMTTTVTTARPSKPLDVSPPLTKNQITLDAMARPTAIAEALDTADQRETTLSWDGDGGGDGLDDGDNNVISMTEAADSTDTTEKAATTFSYEPNGRLLSQTDAVGQTPAPHTTSLSYCSHNGTLDGSAFGTDAAATFVVDLKSIQRPRQNAWTYGLDGGSAEKTDCSGVGKGLVTTQRDPVGKDATASYEPATGLLTQSIDAAGSKTTYGAYDPNGLPQEIVDPEGNDTDDGGSTPDGPGSHRWVYRYDGLGNVISVTDPRAGVRANGVDNATPYTTRLSYDGYDRLGQEKVPRCSGGGACALITAYEYDARDNQTKLIDANLNPTKTTYNQMDRPLTIEDAEGQITAFSYDGEQGLTSITSPKGTATPAADDFKQVFKLDALGRRVLAIQSSTDEQDLITSYDYDQRDRLRGIALPANNANVPETNLQGALDNAGAGATRRFRYDYDALGNLTTETENPRGTCSQAQPDIGLRTTYTYDANDNLASVTSPRASCGEAGSFTTSFEYDLLDRQTKQTDPLGGATNTTYDPVGRVRSVETPRGSAAGSTATGDHTTLYSYDANGDLLSRSVPWAQGQYGIADNGELAANKISYERNEVGDPKRILVPREIKNTAGSWGITSTVAVNNTFYDTGELKSTDRPWWWRLDWGSGHGDPVGGQSFGGTGASGIEPDLAVPVGGPTLSEGGPLSGSGEGRLPGAGTSGDFGTVANEELPEFLPRAGNTDFAYDGVGRLRTVTAKNTGTGVDREFRIDYDRVGRITKKVWPYDVINVGDGPPTLTSISHRFSYDANGNLSEYLDGVANSPEQIPTELKTFSASPLSADDYTTRFSYDQFDRRKSESAPGSADLPATGSQLAIKREVTAYDYDPNGTVKAITTPRGTETAADPNDFKLNYAYDAVDRLKSEANPLGDTWSYAYDADSNQVSITNPRGYTTAQSFDRLGRLNAVTEAQGTAVARTTTLALDPEGNVTRLDAPGAAMADGSAIITRSTTSEFDALGQPWKITTGIGSDASDAANAKRTQIIQRDPAGYVVREVGGIGSAGGQMASSFDPYASEQGALVDQTKQATVNRYDADGLMTASFLPHDGSPSGDLQNGGEGRFKTTYAHDPAGRLRSIDHAYAFTQPTGNCGQNTIPDIQKLGCTTRASYTRYETGWIRSASDSREIDPATAAPVADQNIRYAYDPRGFQTAWRTEAFIQSRNGSGDGGFLITREAYPSGTMYRRDGVKSSESAEASPASERSYTYGYNQNRSLTATQDKLPQYPPLPAGFAQTRTIRISRDAAERQRRVNEDWKGGRDTAFSYDANGNTLARSVDGQLTGSGCQPDGSGCTYAGGRTSTFQYDPLDRESEMLQSGTVGGTRRWTTAWWPSGELKSRSKPNGTTESRFYLPSAEIAEKRRTTASGATQQTYGYDLNANRTFDERGRHAYNARSQLIRWDRPAPQPPAGTLPADVAKYYGGAPAGGESYAEPPSADEEIGNTTYTLDGTAQTLASHSQTKATVEATVGGVPVPRGTRTIEATAAYDYRDGLLRRVRSALTPTTLGIPNLPPESTKHTTTRFDSYDDLGGVGEIRLSSEQDTTPVAGDPAAVAGCGAGQLQSWSADDTTYHCYDAFGRLVVSKAPQAAGEPKKPTESWINDGLDRRDTKLTDDGATISSADRFYVGTSELLSREAGSGSSDPDSKSYAYDSQGLRLGVTMKDSGQPATGFDNYDLDANGSVVGVENPDGSFDRANTGTSGRSDIYRYDPYGQLLDPDPGDLDGRDAEAELTDVAQENPFRFEGFYYDSGIQSYDMQARQYRPEIGRFLSQDRFAAAGADLLLQSDPLTQNRYAFAGGNPVSNIEFDGHYPGCEKSGTGTYNCWSPPAGEPGVDNPNTSGDESSGGDWGSTSGGGGGSAGAAPQPNAAPAPVQAPTAVDNFFARMQQMRIEREALSAQLQQAQLQSSIRPDQAVATSAAPEQSRCGYDGLIEHWCEATEFLVGDPFNNPIDALALFPAFKPLKVLKVLNRSPAPTTIAPSASQATAGLAARGTATAIERFRHAPSGGFLGGFSRAETLRPGMRIDRYGRPGGRYVAPEGTPLAQRALPPGSRTDIYTAYEVVKPLPVRGGITAPYYGRPGLGTQYELPVSVGTLVRRGILRPVP